LWLKLYQIRHGKVGRRVNVDHIPRCPAGENQIKDYGIADLEEGLTIVRLQANGRARILMHPNGR
jgi:hypothetical protein